MVFKDNLIESIEDLYKCANQWDGKYFNHQVGFPKTWFRGQGMDKPLCPSILREELFKDIGHTDFRLHPFRVERDMFFQFLVHSASIVPKGFDYVDTYALAQHHGLPTRLLDWTTSPICALYFAVENIQNDENDGVLYAMNPNALAWGERHLPSFPIIKNHIDNILNDIDNYINIKRAIRSRPMAYGPTWISDRLYAQSARFVFFEPLNKKDDNIGDSQETEEITNGMFFNDNFVKDSNFIGKYFIPAEKKESLRKALYLLGISRRTFFPDLDNIAIDIKEHYRYRKPDVEMP